jgi:hypothetical protein
MVDKLLTNSLHSNVSSRHAIFPGYNLTGINDLSFSAV